MPRSPKAASIRGPTPGSSPTGLERRSVRVIRGGRTLPSAPPTLKVGDAIGPEADVRPDDTADLSYELLLDPEPVGQLREEFGGCDMPEVERAFGLYGQPDLLDHARQLPLATAGTFERNDLPACHLQYGPDIEGGAEEALRPSYAPALGQILERPNGEEQVRFPDGPLRGASDFIESSTLVDTAQGLEQDQTRPHLGAPGIEHVDGTFDHPCRLQGRLIGAAELAREG